MVAILMLFSCGKEKSDTGSIYFQPCKVVPFLTDKPWNRDTVLINPPLTYATLTISEQMQYNSLVSNIFKPKDLTFTSNCRLTQNNPDYDMGNCKWSQSADGKHLLRLNTAAGYVDTLYNYTVSATSFTYEVKSSTGVAVFAISYK